jgi:hypothetical protein
MVIVYNVESYSIEVFKYLTVVQNLRPVYLFKTQSITLSLVPNPCQPENASNLFICRVALFDMPCTVYKLVNTVLVSTSGTSIIIIQALPSLSFQHLKTIFSILPETVEGDNSGLKKRD